MKELADKLVKYPQNKEDKDYIKLLNFLINIIFM
jgi:hypothetical protein